MIRKNAANIVTAICRNCGIEFKRYIRPSRSMPVFCSQVCTGKSFLGKPQSKAQIAKRKKCKSDHPRWAGEQISEKGGRSRALRWYRKPRPCESCGESKSERHHKDGNTSNNDPSNIQFLCRRCHMEADGRLEFIRKSNGRKK